MHIPFCLSRIILFHRPCPIPVPDPLFPFLPLVAPTKSRCRARAKTVGTCLARAVAATGAKARPASRAEKERQAHKTRLVAFASSFFLPFFFFPSPRLPLSPQIHGACQSLPSHPCGQVNLLPKGNHLPGLHATVGLQTIYFSSLASISRSAALASPPAQLLVILQQPAHLRRHNYPRKDPAPLPRRATLSRNQKIITILRRQVFCGFQ
jgi:hypothetical protein